MFAAAVVAAAAVAADLAALIVVAAAVAAYSRPYRLDFVVHHPIHMPDLCNALGVCLDRGSVCMPLMENNHYSLMLDYCPMR